MWNLKGKKKKANKKELPSSKIQRTDQCLPEEGLGAWHRQTDEESKEVQTFSFKS